MKKGAVGKFLVGRCGLLLETLTLFQTEYVIFHTLFQTWPKIETPLFQTYKISTRD